MAQYLKNVATLKLDTHKCIGCCRCLDVCPHAVFTIMGTKVHIHDRDACMECGACAMNCPVEAIRVDVGVGCAQAIFNSWRTGKLECDCDTGCCGVSTNRSTKDKADK